MAQYDEVDKKDLEALRNMTNTCTITCMHEIEVDERLGEICKLCGECLRSLIVDDTIPTKGTSYLRFTGAGAAELNKQVREGSIDYKNAASTILTDFIVNVRASKFLHDIVDYEEFEKSANDFISHVMVKSKTRKAKTGIYDLIVASIYYKFLEVAFLKPAVIARLFANLNTKITVAINKLKKSTVEININATYEKFATTFVRAFKIESQYLDFMNEIVAEANRGSKKMRLISRKPSTKAAGLLFLVIRMLKMPIGDDEIKLVTGINISTLELVEKEILAARQTRYKVIFRKYF